MKRRLQFLTLLASIAAGSAYFTSSVQAQTAPGHAIDQGQTCMECHDLAGSLDGGVPHAPAQNGECSACHNPHVARFAALLKDRPGPLCMSCHQELQRRVDAPNVHRPVKEGRCVECHLPHGGQHSGLLKSPPMELCSSCHADVSVWGKKAVQHSPFARGRCSVCHDPHASESPGLTVGPGSRICTSCHSANESFRAAHGDYPVEKASCQQCHDPHASSQRGLFRESIHAPFASGSCGTCHPAANSRDPFSTLKPINKLCGDCHFDQVAAAQAAPFPHLSAGGSDCVACHNPHMGDGDALLRGSSISVCTQCHDPGGARSGQEGTHMTHGDGLDCSTCHEPHGGQLPLLMREESTELCGNCHSHQHGVTHPLGEETRDPRTGNPLTCLSCHGMHQSAGEKYLFESDIRDLCVGCHKEFAGG